MDSHVAARVILGVIRLINGGLALVVPQFLCRNVGIDPDTTPAAMYVFRMFGIRTVLIAFDLLFATGHEQVRAIEQAPLIHASDTAAAALAAASGRMPARSGKTIVTISAVNTALALWAWRGLRSGK
ncbi:MAG: hypothetical protein JOZ81_19090 [Chloroflexi bacterium]|nr:hypothetical protein [Chloroflexota bacterium]